MNKNEWIKFIRNSIDFPVKNLGQNFLIDDRISERIIEAAGIKEDDYILEIGPGLGALTRQFTNDQSQFICVEIDLNLKDPLVKQFENRNNIDFLFTDFLKIDYKAIQKNKKSPNIVISNLPYYVMTPIFMKLFLQWDCIEKMIFMVEKDACERIFADPGTKSYGPISILSSIYGKKERLFQVGSKAFYPEPHTNSEVIRFTESKERGRIPAVLFPLVRAAFAQRRKTLLNVFTSSALFPEGREQVALFLEKANISPKTRAEDLPPKEYIRFACILEDMIVSIPKNK